MEKLAGHGYVPSERRELRFSFRQARDIVHPDLAAASVQIARGDRQILTEAKAFEDNNRRVWFFLIFPCDSATSKNGKKVVKVDLLIATPFGAMVLKVLDWSGPCITTPGDKWIETKSDGTKVEHPNQLAELDLSMQWVRLFLETKNIAPPTITSYVLFSSPHARPSFTSDPRIIVGPADCSALVSGAGPNNELIQVKSLVEWGQTAFKSVVSKVKAKVGEKSSEQITTAQPEPHVEMWSRFQLCLDSMPQFDLLFLRRNSCYIFGHIERFEDSAGQQGDVTKRLQTFFGRSSARVYDFEHSSTGVIGIPMALVTGGLGLQPMCRIKQRVSGNPSTIDVPPQTKVIFRPYGCEGFVSAEMNDIDSVELARVCRSLNVAEDGTEADVVDQIGQLIGGMLSKSLQAGVKTMLPFPLNNIVN